MNSKKAKLSEWLSKSFQLVLYHSQSYDVVKKINFSRFRLIIFNTIVFIILLSIFFLITVITPLKLLIPGYPDKTTKNLIVDNALRTDSLLEELRLRDQYLGFLRDALFHEIPIDQDFAIPITNLTQDQIDKFNDPRTLRGLDAASAKSRIINNNNNEMPNLFPPIRGVITSSFSPAKKHFGTDIATADEEVIKSVLNGTVIISNFTIETGYTIVIQHSSNILSVYRHAQSVLVNAGDFVMRGQPIAIYGDTGEFSTGKHLHFELWKDGVPIDPEKYISF